MRRTAPILIAVGLATVVRPLQLPAASCILSNAPSPEGCNPHCCANKTRSDAKIKEVVTYSGYKMGEIVRAK